MLGKAAEGARAPPAAGWLVVSWSLGEVVAIGSESAACKQLPDASSENGMSPPSCRKSALSAELVTGV
eukprot:2280014-Pleurochrysis_carterae.AAC.1